MATLEALRHRIDSARDMQSVVGAMKVLAVVSIRQFEQALSSLSESCRAVELGLQAALQNRPRGLMQDGAAVCLSPAGGIHGGAAGAANGWRSCAFVFGSEQGLSGQFNEQIVSFTTEWLDRSGAEPREWTVAAMGEHVAYRLRGAGIDVEKVFSLPGSMAKTGRCVQDIFLYMDELRRKQNPVQATLFYHESLTGATYRPRALSLFPLDPGWLRRLEERPWPGRSRPTFTMDWRELFSALLREHLFLSAERAFAESLLSENSSRLIAMQVAEKNIGEYLDDLKHEFNNQRQGEITAELLDIVAGSQALPWVEEETP